MSLRVGCVRCSVNERGHSEHDKGAQVPRWKSREPMLKNLDETLRVQFEKSEEERDYKGLQRAQVALPV